MNYHPRPSDLDSDSLEPEALRRRVPGRGEEGDSQAEGDLVRPRRRIPWLRLCMWTIFLAGAVAVGVGGPAVTGMLGRLSGLLGPVLGGIGTKNGPPEGPGSTREPDFFSNPAKVVFGDRHRLNILCLGVDYNHDDKTGVRHTSHARSDTMFVVSVDRDAATLSVLSLPRDLWVDIPRHGYDKLNAAFSLKKRGDLATTKATVERLLGMRLDHYVVIREYAAVRMVDAIGGVTVDVEKNMDYDDNWGSLHIHLKKGVQRLNGQQAVGYVRFRKDAEGDRGRIRRQQQFMGCLAQELKKFSTLLKAEELAKAVTENIDSSFNAKELMALALVYRNFDRRTLKTAKFDGDDAIKDGLAVIEPDIKKGQETVALLLRDPRDYVAGDLSLEILNGSDVNGAAGQLAEHMRGRGFRVVSVGNAPQMEAQTVILDRRNDSRASQDVTRVVGKVAVRPTPRAGGQADMTIVLGRDWRDLSRNLGQAN